MENVAIKVEHLTKVYPLYNSRKDRLKEAIHPLRKKYHRDYYALHDVSFEVKKGETVGIIGKNGSGKSTLLKILSGVLTPTSGSFAINGKVSSLLELGTGFSPELTGIENVYFYGMLLGFTKKEMDDMLDDILSFADIGDFVYQPVKSYSSGMYVRLAFSVAVNVKPDILIVDEALAVGDMRFVQKCIRKMKEIQDRGTTLLMVTHDTALVQSMASYCYWFDEGTIREQGIPKDVVKRYISYMSYGLETKGIKVEKEKENNNYQNQLEIYKDDSYAIKYKQEKNKESGRNFSNFNNDKIIKVLLDDSKWISTQTFERFGMHLASIQRVAFLDEQFMPIYQLKGGENVYFLMEIKVFEDLEDVFIGFLINNNKGEAILGINNFIYNNFIKKVEKNRVFIGLFYFQIPKLACGKYSISSAVAMGSQLCHEQLDWIHDCIFFDIVADFLPQRIGVYYACENVTIKFIDL